MMKRDGTTVRGGGDVSVWVAGLATACLVGALALPAGAQAKPKGGAAKPPASSKTAAPKKSLSPYEDLDNQKLCRELSRLGMVEFLDRVVEPQSTGGGSPVELYLLAEAKVAKAMTLTDEALQNKMMDEAVGLLERAIAELAKNKSDDDKQVLRCQYTLRLAVLLGLQRTEKAALRVMYLQGSADDQKTVAANAAKATGLLSKLIPEMDDLKTTWQSDLRKLATVVAELEDKKAEAVYRQAWIRFYLGMALPSGAEKTNALKTAAETVRQYLRPDDDSGVRYLAYLLRGMCLRELKQYKDALENLKASSVPAADRNSRGQAEFELVRCAIEQSVAGKDAALFKGALDAVNAYWKAGEKLHGVDNWIHDLRAAILGNYLYASWAALSASKPDESKKYSEEAEKQFVKLTDLHEKDPGVNDEFRKIISRKYESVAESDYSKLGAQSLMMIAMNLKRQADASKDASAMTKVETLLTQIIARKDVSATIRADAIWQMALIKSAQRKNGEAANYFQQLVKEYPKDPKAPLAALNTVITYNFVIAEKNSRNEVVSPKLRADLVEALTRLLNNYAATDKKVEKYFFDLGFHCEKIAEACRKDADKKAWMLKAIEGYDHVAPAAPETMDARNNSLTLQCDLLEMTDKTAQKGEGEKLVTKLQAFGADLARAIAGASADGAKLREYGSLIEFRQAQIQYEILDRKQDALSVIEALAGKWPGTSVLRVASRWMVAKLVEEARTDDAIRKVEDIGQKYPQDKDVVIQMVIQQIRDRINKLRGDATQLEKFKHDCAVYLTFAKQLYDKQKEDYQYQQMYAEAMIENGQPDQAVPLLLKCKEANEAKREVERKKIEENVAQKVAAIGSATNAIEIQAQVKEFEKMLADKGYKPEMFSQVMLLQTAAQRLAESPEDKVRVDIVANRLRDAWEALKVRMARNVSVDATNVHGLARAYFGQKKYVDALRYYNELVPGIDKNANSKFYFEALVEQFKCMFEVYRGSQADLAKLRIVIQQMKMDLGDKLPDELVQMESEINKIVEPAPKGAAKG